MKNIAFDVPNVHIIGTHHFGNTENKEFKNHEYFQDVLNCRDYAKREVASFAHPKPI